MNVLVAHENDTIRGVIETLLREAGYVVSTVADGAGCRAGLTGAGALVLDVSISEPYSWGLIDEARARAPRVPVVLVASIYNRTSYKRKPTQLYGADDYVEQHHLPDQLVPKLSALVGPPPARPNEAEAAARGLAVRAAAERDEGLGDDPQDPIARAERLARLIVSDIALYNGDAILAARRRGMESLEARLRTDLDEGRLIFDLRVPASVRKGRDFIGEALHELVHADAGQHAAPDGPKGRT